MSRAERKQRANEFRVALKIKFGEMLADAVTEGRDPSVVDEFVLHLKAKHPDKAAVIDQAYREYARELTEALERAQS